MAVYFLRCKHISRKNGSQVTHAAAYRAGERIRDERTGEIYDYSARSDVAYKEVVLPAELSGRHDMAWTQDRSILWNAAEHAGRQYNSRLAREWLVLLPSELTAQQRAQLVRTFATELADQYRCAIDVCIHLPRSGADSRHHHAHMLMSTREVTPEGFGRRTNLELSGSERRLFGMTVSSKDEYLAIRQRWAEVSNEALRQAGLDMRIDHRSYKERGINRDPRPTIPEKVFYAERKLGMGTAAGDAIRARHRERVEARAKGEAELLRVQHKQRAQLKERALEDLKRQEGQPKKIRWGVLTREERNARRRELYQTRRAMERAGPTVEVQKCAMSQAECTVPNQLNSQVRKHPNPEVRGAVRPPELSKSTSPTAEESARNWMSFRQTQGRGPTAEEAARNWGKNREAQGPGQTAEEAARNWQSYRETHGPGPTAEESARAWQAMRERERLSGSSETKPPRSREQDLEGASPDDEDRKLRRQRGLDFEP